MARPRSIAAYRDRYARLPHMSTHARVLVVLAAIAVAPFVAGVGAFGLQASTSSNWWGVDTVSTTWPSFLNALKSGYGTPRFVGRYVTWGGGTPIQASESDIPPRAAPPDPAARIAAPFGAHVRVRRGIGREGSHRACPH